MIHWILENVHSSSLKLIKLRRIQEKTTRKIQNLVDIIFVFPGSEAKPKNTECVWPRPPVQNQVQLIFQKGTCKIAKCQHLYKDMNMHIPQIYGKCIFICNIYEYLQCLKY